MVARLGLDQLPGHTDTLAQLADAAFQYVAHAELAGDLLGIHRLALVGERGVAGDNEESAVAGQRRDDVFDNAVDEVILLRIAAEIYEGQDRE
jgi:hypothetical protein